MFKDVLKILRCPICKASFSVHIKLLDEDEIIEGKLTCECHHTWSIHEGIADFNVQEQDEVNSWSKLYEQYDYEALDAKIISETPASFKRITSETKKEILEKVQRENPNFLLDIACGRGELLQELLLHITNKTQIICVDLSYQVLRYNRLKSKKIAPAMRVNYIACDASCLPFVHSSMDMAVSLFGIANMFQLIPNGVNEAYRILKKGHYLLSSYIAIHEKSNGYQILTQYCKDNGMKECAQYYLEESIQKIHEEGGFNTINRIVNGESFGEKNDIDLIPFVDEWYRVFLMECLK